MCYPYISKIYNYKKINLRLQFGGGIVCFYTRRKIQNCDWCGNYFLVASENLQLKAL